MSLHQLAECMGDDASLTEAEEMRDLLVEKYDGWDTADVPDHEWSAMLDKAVIWAAEREAEAARDDKEARDIWGRGDE